MKQSYIYILTNKNHTTFYTGVTSDLIKRIYEHKMNLTDGFTKKYRLHKLIYYEQYSDIFDAITREKRLKRWKRKWKLQLITEFNPTWRDLYEDLI